MEIIKFQSKRNEVYLNADGYVIKKVNNKNDLRNEVKVYQLLNTLNMTPMFLNIEDSNIILEYINGDTLLSMYENQLLTKEVIIKLVLWLKKFYNSTSLILNDIHLKNFIYSNEKVYGIDFELCKRGYIEEDISYLFIFLFSYDDIDYKYKIQTCTVLIEYAISILNIDKILLSKYFEVKFEIIKKRRKKLNTEYIDLKVVLDFILNINNNN